MLSGFPLPGLVPPDVSAKTGYNRLRRCMPTGGHHLGISEADAQAIGSWTELPASAGSATSRRLAKPMSRHYAGDNIHSSWQVKQRVVNSMLQVFRTGSWPRAEGSALLKPGCLTWPQLGQLAANPCISADAKPVPIPPDEGDSSSEASSESADQQWRPR